MTHLPPISWAPLAIAAATLIWAAYTDLREFTIRNTQVLALVGLYLVYAITSKQQAQILWNVGFALIMGLALLLPYSRRHMGGGDLKLMTVAFLWTGLSCALTFTIVVLVFVGLHAFAAKFSWIAAERSAQGTRIPLAPSISGALLAVMAIGCLKSQFA